MKLPFETWLPAQRWYSGRGRELVAAAPTRTAQLAPDLELVLLQVSYVDGPAEQYQVLVRWSDGDGRDDSARIGSDGDRDGYDAMADPATAGLLLRLLEDSETVGPVTFTREPGAQLPADRAGRRLGAEQSNTSVVFGDQAILKVFRRVVAGTNPDIELTRALAGNAHVTPLLGSYRLDSYALGMLTTFAAGSTDGWDLALAAAGDPAADFTGESHRLGEAVGTVHADLAARLGTATAPFPVDTWIQRLRAVAGAVPQLREYVPDIETRYRALTDAPSTVQRIHGDLHLGQVLRTPSTWLVIDFEGEPGQPLTERRRRDSAVRDIAGMLRSYDYAAHHEAGDSTDWAARSCAAFCAGYAAVQGADPRDDAAVLAAYELDKAVYEVGYEARYRPAWLSIPLGAVVRVLTK